MNEDLERRRIHRLYNIMEKLSTHLLEAKVGLREMATEGQKTPFTRVAALLEDKVATLDTQLSEDLSALVRTALLQKEVEKT